MAQIITGQLRFYNNRVENYQPVYLSADFQSMDIKEIRRVRLRKLIDDRYKGFAARLAAALEMKPPQLHRWLAGGQGISEESARGIEKKLELSPWWLDYADGSAVMLTDQEASFINNFRQLSSAERDLFAEELRRRAVFSIQISEGSLGDGGRHREEQ